MAATNKTTRTQVNSTRNSDISIAAIQQMLHLMDDPVFAYDETGTLTYVNRAYDVLLATDVNESMVGKNIIDLEPYKRELNQKMLDTNLARRPGDPLLVIESPSIGTDGRTRWYEWRNLQQFDEDGNVILVVGISRDITRQRLAELRTERVTARLEESNRDLLEFAQVASHDLREPLRKVAAFSERIERRLGDNLDDRVRDYMERMASAVGRMQGLIDDLLTFSRVNTRVAAIETTALDDIVEATLSDLEIAIDESDAVIDVGQLPSLPVDASQIGQLFQNLIANAIKFRRPGVAPHIEIAARFVPSTFDLLSGGDADAYEITVEDNGIGFEQEYAAKIFAPFQRLHGRTEYEGSGVGLSVCRRIVERHQGRIWADGGEGDGATFAFRLPVVHLDEVLVHDDKPELVGLSVEHSIIDTLAA